eukprot:TRINITY_DN59094_c0_g1_i3.p2 TRINITY_DN59094_c0_g1~~TRINITY_DN59094_c0_g1_i3.p2  ORF type:complete len:146 (-),score=8.02 TRINITY_DN59094_c0_g1_i3:414-851(-)
MLLLSPGQFPNTVWTYDHKSVTVHLQVALEGCQIHRQKMQICTLVVTGPSRCQEISGGFAEPPPPPIENFIEDVDLSKSVVQLRQYSKGECNSPFAVNVLPDQWLEWVLFQINQALQEEHLLDEWPKAKLWLSGRNPVQPPSHVW